MASDLLFQRCQAYEVKWKKLPLRGIDTPLSDRIWLHQVTLGDDSRITDHVTSAIKTRFNDSSGRRSWDRTQSSGSSVVRFSSSCDRKRYPFHQHRQLLTSYRENAGSRIADIQSRI